MNAAVSTVLVSNAYGMHARPATRFVEVASGFEAEIEVSRDGDHPVNGKSVMGLLTLAAEKGTPLTIRARGSDAEAAVARLSRLVGAGFEMQETH